MHLILTYRDYIVQILVTDLLKFILNLKITLNGIKSEITNKVVKRYLPKITNNR
jgi:hypothetical protein